MGTLHRRIEIATQRDPDGSGEARAVVEDDYHHFRVHVRHAGGVVTKAWSQALRHPETTCAMAGERLGELVGVALSDSSVAMLAHVDARQQCTHQIDMAGLAIAAAARGLPRRTYEVAVPDRVEGRTRASVSRDGREVLAWEMDGSEIAGPAPYAGRNIGTGFTGWARTALDLDEAEAALVLRRVVFISSGHEIDLDAPGRDTGPIGGCWVWQPERAAQAKRVMGSTLDFTGRPELLTSEDRDWLAFKEAG